MAGKFEFSTDQFLSYDTMFFLDTVDGQNPAPPGMAKTLSLPLFGVLAWWFGVLQKLQFL